MKAAYRLALVAVLCLGGTAVDLFSANQEQAEPSLQQKIYYFQHMLLPRWTHESEGAFPADMEKGRVEGLRRVATEIIGREYAEGVRVKPLAQPTGALILFPKPERVTECYAVAVLRDEGGFRYFTLELAEEGLGEGIKTFLCEWTKKSGDISHANLGGRPYTDEEHFVVELRQIMGKAVSPPEPTGRD